MAKLFRRDEITNIYGQRIYMYASQTGDTDLERCISFTKAMGLQMDRYDIDGNTYIVMSNRRYDIFNSDGDKVGEMSSEQLDGVRIRNEDDLRDILQDE